MSDENFVIQVILRARDEMGRALGNAQRHMKGFRGEVNQSQADMKNFDRSSANTTRGLERLGSRLDQVRGKFNAIRGPTNQASGSMRSFGNTARNLNDRLITLNSTVHKNRESIAKFDNEIRGLRLLIAFAQFQALTSAVIGLGGALTAVAGSAVTAGAALGGAMTAAAAQAVPAVGLMIASLGRLKAVFDVVSQAEKTQEAEATQATSATNKQADQVDKLTNAQNSLRDAHERVTESQKGVNEARRQARRDLEDLVLSERASQLQFEQAEDRVRQLRSSGTTGFELREAQLQLEESRVDRRRTGQDLRQASTRIAPGIQDAQKSLRDAQQALADARRGLAGARRDIGEGGAATVAAGRQLQYLQAQLTQSERRLVKSITNLKDTWREVSRPITDIIVDSFTRATDRAEKVIQSPKLIGAFKELAKAGGREMDRISDTFMDARGVAFLERSTNRLTENLRPAGIAAQSLAHAFMNIADAAGPTLHNLVQDIAKLAGGIERATENDRALGNLFAYGRVQLLGWFRLARSIGEVIKAVIAPGGDLQSGAAASGLRLINDLTNRFRQAAEWINEHPLEMAEFFGDSEEVFKRLLDLVIVLGEHLLNLFDPGTVDAFADIIEALLPPFEHAVVLLGTLTKGFAALMQVPGIREAMQIGFGLVVFARIGGRLQALFLGFLGPLTTMLTVSSRIGKTFLTLFTTTGGLTARITAASAAWKTYAASATSAATATKAVATSGAVIIPRNVAGATAAPAGYGRNPAIFGAPTSQGAGATARTTGVVAGVGAAASGLVSGLATVGKVLAPIAAALAVFDFASRSGSVTQRARGTLGAGTFGLSEQVINRFGSRTRGQIEGPSASIIDQLKAFGGADDEANPILERIRKGLRQAVRDEDIGRFKELNKELNRMASQNWGEQTNKEADKLKRAVRGVGDAIRKTIHEGHPEDILNQETVNRVLKNMQELRSGSVDNIHDLQRQFQNNFDRIRDSTQRGSEAWKNLVTKNFGAGIKGVINAVNDGQIKVGTGMEAINRITRRQMKFVKENMETLSLEAKDKLAGNFRAARLAVTRQAGGIENATEKTLKRIRRLMAQELELYGLEPAQARRLARARSEGDLGTSFIGGPEEGSRGPGAASGLWLGKRGERGIDGSAGMVAGHRVGRGELLVANAGQQRLIDAALHGQFGYGIDELARKMRGAHAGVLGMGWASGSSVRGLGGGIRNIVQLGRKLQQLGYAVGEHPAFGGVAPVHTANSYHYRGLALDVNADAMPGGEPRNLDRLYAQLKGMPGIVELLWRVADHYDHLHVAMAQGGKGFLLGGLGMPAFSPRKFRGQIDKLISKNLGDGGGALGDIGRATAVMSGEAAVRMLKKATAAQQGMEGSEAAGKGVAAAPGQLRSWLSQALKITKLFSAGNLNALYGRALQESGGNPRAINLWDSNAAAGHPSKGLLQTIDSTFAAYMLPGMGNIWNPIHNAVAAIRYMMARYGHIVGPSGSGYAMGGMIPGPDGAPRSILAHAGEWVLNKGQQVKAAGLAGMSAGELRDRLGFTGGPTGYQGGGLVVGDSIAAGMEKFLKRMGFRVNAVGGRSAEDTLEALKKLISDRTKRVVFDAGTNDSDPQMLRKVLNNLMRVVGDRQLLLTTAGGQNAAAKNAVIRDFAKRDNVNLFNSQAFARSKGFELDAAGHYPGASAYRARARAVSRALGGGGQDTAFDAPDILPITLKGLGKLVNEFFKHLKQFKKKGEDNFKAVNRNMDALTQDGGLLDQMGAAIERQVAIMTQRITRRGLRVRRGVVRDVRGEVGDLRAEARVLDFQTGGLRREDRTIGRGLRVVRRSLRQIRRGGIDEDEREIFADLVGQRRNLQNRRQGVRQSITENLQARFELQGRRIQAQLNAQLRPILARAAQSELAQRIATAFGRGGEIGFIDAQINVLKEQKPFIEAALRRAQAQGQTEIADQLTEQLLDIEGTIQELIAQRLEQQVADVNKRFDRARRVADLRDRLASATGTLSLDRIIPGLGGTRRSAFEARGSAIEEQIAALTQLLGTAWSEGNVKVWEELRDQIEDLRIELVENSRQLFLSRIEEVNRKFGTISGQATARSRIAELQAELGIITGTESQVRQRAELTIIGSGLQAQAVSLQQLLTEARQRQDEEQIASLEQAILDNTVAQLENSLAVKNLDGSLNDTQSFSSTAWQWFRTAIFTGSGGLLPQFNFGSTMGTTGALPSPTIGGGIAPMGTMSSPIVNLEINEAGQVPDPVYLGNRIAWATRTPGT